MERWLKAPEVVAPEKPVEISDADIKARLEARWDAVETRDENVDSSSRVWTPRVSR